MLNENIQQDPIRRTEEDRRIMNLTEEIKGFIQEDLNQTPNTLTNAVIVLGRTGSGKSTLINLLAGKPLFSHQNEHTLEFFLDSPDMLPRITIGNQLTAETSVPNSWVYNDSTVYWDCPGFDDNRGAKQELVNSFLIKNLFNVHKNCKIIIVVPDADLNDRKAAKLLSMVKDLNTFFQSDVERIRPGLMLVISGAHPDKTVEHVKKTFQRIIDTPEFNLTDPQKGGLRLLINNPVIMFKRPVLEGAFDATTCARKCLDTIEGLNVIHNLQVNLSISSDTRLTLLAMYNHLLHSINLEIDNLTSNLGLQLQSSIARAQDSKDPNELQTAVKDLQQTSARFANRAILLNQQLLLEIIPTCMQFNLNRNMNLPTLNLGDTLNKTKTFDFLEQFIEHSSKKESGIQAAIAGYLSNSIRDANAAIQTIAQRISEEKTIALQFELQKQVAARIAAEAEARRLATAAAEANRQREEAEIRNRRPAPPPPQGVNRPFMGYGPSFGRR